MDTALRALERAARTEGSPEALAAYGAAVLRASSSEPAPRAPGGSFGCAMNKGFHLIFGSGWGVSVQWGPGNYCENYYRGLDFAVPMLLTSGEPWTSDTAEVAILFPGGGLLPLKGGEDSGDTVRGYVSPERVADLLAVVASVGADTPVETVRGMVNAILD